ncbi:VirD4-like conjugal transfer protein, CD1115 family [Vagococcus xieshaowenii]|uniref:DUF5011 domain-containing protein n=1 Tax=Vagococcus xieshaowenii TaxID=2562451 RepID=A0AAJ5EGZ6_9ENTE|nr:type IV secretory system conjugative DNA transfer family protein [Vagococcus xieshaowenii]QCA29681.1 DUF5011 domain-containing protein [Vagococcus xieshaowenii]TFZ42956.1 DUF5011 domain-containing protein [Vagococcus xieshaowenii]
MDFKKLPLHEDKNIVFLTKLKAWLEVFGSSDKKKVVWIGLVIVATVLGNVFSSFLYNIFYMLPNGYPLQSFVGFHLIKYFWVYAVLYLLTIPLYYYLLFRIKINYESLEEGNKATGRFTTVDELIAQYKEVPIKGEHVTDTYEGASGTIIARRGDKLYIDTDPAHNSILGRSRAAKGQTKVIPDMDVYSRSEEKPHLVFASGKYELAVAGMGKKTLEKRGYECHVLNLIEMSRSFQYNPLDLVKEAYMQGDIDNAIELCKTFSYPLYHNEEAREPIWEETAMALVNAVILALCHEFIEKSDDPQKTEKYITMYAVSNMLVELGTPNEKGDTLLDKYFENLPPGNPAKLEYSTVMYAEGQMRSSIFATTQAKLRNFTAPKVAKLMAKSTFNFKKLTKDSTPFDMTDNIRVEGYVDTSKPGTYLLKYSITNEFDEVFSIDRTIVVGEQLMYHTTPNPDDYFKGVDHVNMPVGVTFNPLQGVSCWYYYKPQAIFLVLPDYIQTNYIIASTWISQMYHVASDEAANLPGGKLKKRIRVPLDEFGNLPGFSNIGSMLSVGAGRGILFDFYVQHPNQLTTRYSEKVGEFIADEAMNKFFLLSGSKKAREDFSSILGEKEVTVKSRSGGVFDLNKQMTESVETRPLLTPYELGRLEEGEVVVERSIHRQDLQGKPVRPHPIMNTGEEGKLLYAHKYLKDDFDPDLSWETLNLPYVPDFPLEEYSQSFVKRIKHPLSLKAQEEIDDEKRKEYESIMTEAESKLDNHYKTTEGDFVAADLSTIRSVYLDGERKSLVEVVGSDHVSEIHELFIEEHPDKKEEIDGFDYFDEYTTFLEKQGSMALKMRLQGLPIFKLPKKTDK